LKGWRCLPVVVSVAALLGGCAGLVPGPSTPPPVRYDSPGQVVERAEAAVGAGRWTEAQSVLDAGRRQFPDSAPIAQLSGRVADTWSRLQPEWEDRLAVSRARALEDELALRQRLERADPAAFPEADGSVPLRAYQLQLRAALLRCARRQLDVDLELARACVDLAHRADPDAESARLRQQVVALEAEIARTAEKQREKVRRIGVNADLSRAEELLQAGRYGEAETLLARVRASDPDNPLAHELQERLRAEVTRQTQRYGEEADRLYAEGRIAEAARAWQRSLELDADQPAVRERLERARRVLENLERLRDGAGQP
jgi:tetratricopeptide (TPR) repeat protein